MRENRTSFCSFEDRTRLLAFWVEAKNKINLTRETIIERERENADNGWFSSEIRSRNPKRELKKYKNPKERFTREITINQDRNDTSCSRNDGVCVVEVRRCRSRNREYDCWVRCTTICTHVSHSVYLYYKKTYYIVHAHNNERTRPDFRRGLVPEQPWSVPVTRVGKLRRRPRDEN